MTRVSEVIGVCTFLAGEDNLIYFEVENLDGALGITGPRYCQGDPGMVR